MSLKSPIAALINRLGSTITLTNPGASTYDPATGIATAGDSTTATAKADVVPRKMREGLDVEDGDLTATVAAPDWFTISLETLVTFNGNQYRALSVAEMFAFGEMAAITLQLRRIGNG